MTDNKINFSLNRKLRSLAEKQGIGVAEQNSYFKYSVENGIIRYYLPDMEQNQFIKEAIELTNNFLKEPN